MAALLDRLGGEEAIRLVVDKFYDKVFADPALAPFFVKSNLEQQRQRQGSFLIQVLSGKAANAAEYMRWAHQESVQKMGLNDTHFSAVAGHLAATLKQFQVTDELIAEVVAALGDLRPAVLNLPE